MSTLRARGDRTPALWCVGGGKGGIGKTLIAASLGWTLARQGRRVALVDGDIGGANLHTCLGMPAPRLTLADFVARRVPGIADVAVQTGVPRLVLLSGASAFLGAADIRHAQKMRVLQRVRDLDVDVVLIDLGAGTSTGVVDFFIGADVPILVVMPEPTSVENAYALLVASLMRKMRTRASELGQRGAIDAALERGGAQAARRPDVLLEILQARDATLADNLERELKTFQPQIVVNQVRGPEDEAIGEELVAVCERHLGISPRYVGSVRHEEAVWRAVRRRRLFLADAPNSGAASDLQAVCETLCERDAATEVMGA